MWIAVVGCLLVLSNAFTNGQYGDMNSDESPEPIDPIPLVPDTPNPYGQKPDPPSPSPYGVRPVPKPDTPSPYGVRPVPKPDTPSPYGQKPVPKPDTPSPYGQKPVPKPDTPSPYGQKPYGGGMKPIITPINPVEPGDDIITLPPPTSCPLGRTWTDVVGCYECEIRKSAESCKSLLPVNFDFCSNKTALFRMSALFTNCLSTKPQTCHKLNENMAFAFLLANYDSDIVDLNRRNECLFERSRAPVMQCMSQCDAMTDRSSIDNEPIVLCYNELHDQISAMLHDFSDCISADPSHLV